MPPLKHLPRLTCFAASYVCIFLSHCTVSSSRGGYMPHSSLHPRARHLTWCGKPPTHTCWAKFVHFKWRKDRSLKSPDYHSQLEKEPGHRQALSCFLLWAIFKAFWKQWSSGGLFWGGQRVQNLFENSRKQKVYMVIQNPEEIIRHYLML